MIECNSTKVVTGRVRAYTFYIGCWRKKCRGSSGVFLFKAEMLSGVAAAYQPEAFEFSDMDGVQELSGIGWQDLVDQARGLSEA